MKLQVFLTILLTFLLFTQVFSGNAQELFKKFKYLILFLIIIIKKKFLCTAFRFTTKTPKRLTTPTSRGPRIRVRMQNLG